MPTFSLEREASERHDAQALGLATFVQKYKFVATLLMLSDVLPPLASLSRAFQKKDLDYTLVKPLVSGTRATLQNLKATPGQHFATLDDVLGSNLESFNISLPATDTFKTTIYDRYIDVVDNHLTRRFPNIELLEAFSIFDGQHWPDELQLYGVEHLVTLADHFTPTIVDLEKLKCEWEMFKNSACESLPLRSMNAQEVMALLVEKTDLADLFPNLFCIALIGLLIPTSTADCERGFSALKRIKTPLRNRLSNPICVNLLFISIEGPTHDLLSMGIQKKQKNRHFKVTSDSRTVIHVHKRSILVYTLKMMFSYKYVPCAMLVGVIK